MKPESIKVLVCDLHKRTSGVSTTIRSQIPLLTQNLDIAFVAYRDHKDCCAISLKKALTICQSPLPKNVPFRIWHARRNNEMIWGLIFKYVFRCEIKLLFTSAAKRRHSWFPRKLIHSMDKIIATTKEAASYVPNVDCVIGHGVDETVFKPANNKAELKQTLLIQAKVNVAIIGRVRPEKGTDVFINSMLDVFKKHNNIDAYIFGLVANKHKKFATELKHKIKQQGLTERFNWMGVVDIHKMPLYQSCMDVTVAPAKYEGYGMVPLEAMACANAVIATDTGAYKVMIKQGETGFIIQNEAQLTRQMNTLLDEPTHLEELGKNGLKRVLKKFTLNKEVSQIIGVYQSWWNNHSKGSK
ncbi:MAG: glycosyltransferase family 4 protein [Saccharospirillaceae bacterium]|nr:glycosyltransferase family 4 protein [Pseudomonadales bacterium]NRB80457.1 glycosyltransferase family 4 protein [Saccharospirillaceae bacterium]